MKSRTSISVVLLLLTISSSSAPLLADACQTFRDPLSRLQSTLQSDNQHLDTLRAQLHEEQNHVPVSSGQPWGKTGQPLKPTKASPDYTQNLIDAINQQIKQTEQEIATAEQQLAQCEANLIVHVVPRPAADDLKTAVDAVHALVGRKPLSEPDEGSFDVGQVGMATPAPATEIPEGFAGKDSPLLAFPSFDGVSGSGGDDPQIAVGKKWIVVTAYNRIKFYRYGDTTPEPAGQYLTSNPISTVDLFAPLLDPRSSKNVDHNLKSMGVPTCMCDPKGAQANNSCPRNMSSTVACTREIYDIRVAYDEKGDRFYILGHTRPHPKDLGAAGGNNLRRSFNFLAVTKEGGDPHKGFDYFWWNEVMDEGCPAAGIPCATGLYTPGQAADYPSFAITEPYLIEADDVKHHDRPGLSTVPGYQIVHIIPLEDLRHPPTSETVTGTSMWDKSLIGLRPVQHLGEYSSTPTSWHLVRTATQQGVPGMELVSFTDSGQNMFQLTSAFVKVTPDPTLKAGQKCSPDPAMPDTQNLLKFSNLGNSVRNAVMRDDGHIWAVWQGCAIWPGSKNIGISTVVVAEVDAKQATRLNSAVIGGGARGEKSDVGYGNPGVTVTENGDAVIVYTRSSANIFPEARYSVWRKGDPTPMGSNVLHLGDCSPTKAEDPKSAISNFDTAGIASDPGVKNVVWMAHDYFHDASGHGCVPSDGKAPEPETKMAIGKLNAP